MITPGSARSKDFVSLAAILLVGFAGYGAIELPALHLPSN
jgi:hypothetical protein